MPVKQLTIPFVRTLALLSGLSLVLVDAAFSQTHDGVPPSRERACEEAKLSGSLLGLCRAYWEAKDCDVLNSAANKRSCDSIAADFRKRSGGLEISKLFLPSAKGKVTSAGGEISLPGYGKVVFPSNAFLTDTVVTVSATRDAHVATSFNEFASIFLPANRLAYELRIIVGAVPPVSDTVHIEVVVPDDFAAAVPPDFQIELFAQVLSHAEEVIDLFEIFPASYDPVKKAISADLPTAVFSTNRSSMSEFEAIVTLAPTPGINRVVTSAAKAFATTTTNSSASAAQLATASQCDALPIACPISDGCAVTSPFSPARVNPVTGAEQPHAGVDYRAPNGTPVLAAESGTIERSYTSTTYGETIVLRHDNGSATLYAHLELRLVSEGEKVDKGQQLATSDNTGQSTGPHLHFEYVPNGNIIQSKNRIDPDACVGAATSGSLTVRDNGNLADDAFEVSVDGIRIGATTIGASNTLAINNLIPGNHSLVITAIIAPDNVGTYEVSLSDGLVFANGLTAVSGVIPQGGSAAFTFIVPQR